MGHEYTPPKHEYWCDGCQEPIGFPKFDRYGWPVKGQYKFFSNQLKSGHREGATIVIVDRKYPRHPELEADLCPDCAAALSKFIKNDLGKGA